jgi:hypothetical protein
VSGVGQPSNLVRNERYKLLATALNNVAVAVLATAVIAPAAAFLYGTSHAGTGRWWLFSAAWLALGTGLHALAQLILGRLAP